jgi:hypothetical protein
MHSRVVILGATFGGLEVRILYRDITMPGVIVRRELVLSVDPERMRVVTNPRLYDADVLVVAAGADIAPTAIPGARRRLAAGPDPCRSRGRPVSRSKPALSRLGGSTK